MVELRSPNEPAPMRISAAAVATRSEPVFREARAMLHRMGIRRVLHAVPHKLLDLGPDVFWIVDGRLPGAMDVIRMLLSVGRRNGMVLSNPFDHRFNTQCARIGVPALLMHRAAQEAEVIDDIGGYKLSAREIGIVGLVAQGKSNSDIAAALHLSPLTVKSHLTRISRRIGAADRANLVYRCLRAGIIE